MPMTGTVAKVVDPKDASRSRAILTSSRVVLLMNSLIERTRISGYKWQWRWKRCEERKMG
jgi:hypothetical protein